MVYKQEKSYFTQKIGKQLKLIRSKKYKITIEELANEMDVSIKTIQTWENGNNSLKIERIISLYEAFLNLVEDDIELTDFLDILVIDAYE